MKFDNVEINGKFSYVMGQSFKCPAGEKYYFRKVGATLAIRLSDEKKMVFYPDDEVEPVKN